MVDVKELKVGDSIICKGVKATIGNILSQQIYNACDLSCKCIDIEFEDTYGNYRNWKSEVDGGVVEYNN